jgi:elongation factor P hydroxylase
VTTAADLEAVFHDCFLAAYETRLCGGADEPLYEPAAAGVPATIYYREDYAASALHEVAHWCIAGERRRRQVDYGYWYVPDGRGAGQQAEFERVEARPQALEWHFALAAGLPFRVSVDNLSRAPSAATDFEQAVAGQAQRFCREALPARAARFRSALALRLGGITTPRPDHFLSTGR